MSNAKDQNKNNKKISPHEKVREFIEQHMEEVTKLPKTSGMQHSSNVENFTTDYAFI